jgi:hypothetical protein
MMDSLFLSRSFFDMRDRSIVSMVYQVFSTGCGRERLAEGFFVGLRDASVGYVIVVPRTLAKGVRV